jgi:hypothetical protein
MISSCHSIRGEKILTKREKYFLIVSCCHNQQSRLEAIHSLLLISYISSLVVSLLSILNISKHHSIRLQCQHNHKNCA